MSILFDDSPVILFARAAGLIMCCELVFAIPVVWAISERDEALRGKCFGFSKVGWKDVRVATEYSFALIPRLCTSDNCL